MVIIERLDRLIAIKLPFKFLGFFSFTPINNSTVKLFKAEKTTIKSDNIWSKAELK